MKLLSILFLITTSISAQTVSTFFSNPTADVDDSMVFDSNGDLYGSNFDGDTVFVISPGGLVSPHITGLANPNGLAFDAGDNLFVCEYSAQRINKYDPTGNLIVSYPVNGFPSGLTRSFDGTAMIFTNVSNNSVNRLEANGTINVLFQGSPLNAPVGLTYDLAGNLFIGNFTGNEIYKLVGSNVEYVATVPNGGATGGNQALGFIVHANGKLYGTNFGGHQIYSINPNAVDDVVLFAGSVEGNADGPVASATFSFPNGIIFNASENALYVSEFSGLGNIRKIEDVPLSVTNFSTESNIRLYPNPSNNNITLEGDILSGSRMVNIDLFSIDGRLLRSFEYENSSNYLKFTIDISDLSEGNYVVKISSNNHNSSTSFIKS